jgi:hypothetical protein
MEAISSSGLCSAEKKAVDKSDDQADFEAEKQA